MVFIEEKIKTPIKEDEPYSFPEPIFLKKIHYQIIRELTINDFKVTTRLLANKCGCSHTTISRHISSLANEYDIKWQSQVNRMKMGLQHHLLYIQIPVQNGDFLEKLTNTLEENRYLSNISIGKNKNSYFIFSNIASPQITAVLISRRLEKYLKESQIESFEILPVIKEEQYLGIVLEEFQPTNHSIQLLLNNNFPVKRVKTSYYDRFKDQSLYKFKKKDSMLLQFLSLKHSIPLTKKIDNEFWIYELIKNGLNKETEFNIYLELLPLLNKLQKSAVKQSLLDYRLVITQKQKSNENLQIKIQLSTEDRLFHKIKKALTVFASTIIFYSHNQVLFIINNINKNSVYTSLILEHLKQFTDEFTFFFAVSKSQKDIPLSDLYDFQAQKWYLS